MKITRFAQSCLLIETKSKRILIDPGNFLISDELFNHDWSDIDILLITHKHQDYCYLEAVKRIMANQKTILYTTQEVYHAYSELNGIVVKSGDIIKIEDIHIEVTKAVHGYVPRYKRGNGIEEGVGYIIDDGDKKLYTTGDTIGFENEYRCDIICLPVSNHGVTMGTYDAALFAKETEASLVLPIHLENPAFPVDYDNLKKHFESQDLNYRVLKIKESILV